MCHLLFHALTEKLVKEIFKNRTESQRVTSGQGGGWCGAERGFFSIPTTTCVFFFFFERPALLSNQPQKGINSLEAAHGWAAPRQGTRSQTTVLHALDFLPEPKASSLALCRELPFL